MCDVVLLAKAIHRFATFGAQFGFQRARLVVEAGMYDAAIMARLMSAKMIFGFEKDQTKVWLCIKERICNRYADDASANNRDVVKTFTHCGWILTQLRRRL